jgi:outer membrane protein assembly factor BamD
MRQITAVDRDPTPIDAAVDTFQKVLTDYPDTLYAVEAEKKITLLLPQLAEYQFRIGLFYERQATYPAAIARFQQALKKVAHGALAEKAIYHLGRSLAENGNREEAKQTFQRLMLEYPDSDYLRKDKIAL